ncbi:hypothetical protein B296_00001630 [Ensete ventricosum]|uniref:Calmodulin binding protein-like N-terminal domain-containing protein n=1 Tax=Ensete ventricosum TaxID=4639 RepID=A0A427B529_ENSVE|nr:hypothetical protein B296_00001630 [Ensete ventricosum]
MQRPGRYERQGTSAMPGEKRGMDAGDGDGLQPEPKRPKVPALASFIFLALCSVIVEALKVDSLQKICSSLEPILRRVVRQISCFMTDFLKLSMPVSEEVERALARLGPARIGGRSSPKRIEGPDGRNLQLHFRTRLSLPLFTGGKVEGEQGAAIHVVLFDANSGHVVSSGLEASAKLDVLVLEGDFNNEDDENWTEEEFESHVVKEREGKRPLLTGDLQVSLKDGVGTLGELTFTDNSSWIRSRKFRLGLKIASGYCEGVRIREAKTEAFTVKDHRGECGTTSAGYDGTQSTRFSNLTQHVDSDAHISTESTSSTPQNQFVGSTHQTQFTRTDGTSLAPAPPQQASMELQSLGHTVEQPDLSSYDDWSRQRDSRGIDDFFSEDEIRLRSHELLEHEDMQHLLRVFTMGGAPTGLHDDGYAFSSYMPSPGPTFNFDDDRSRTSGKAVVGWLKIKAAMRWGIFVRKKAAERRAAQLVELED